MAKSHFEVRTPNLIVIKIIVYAIAFGLIILAFQLARVDSKDNRPETHNQFYETTLVDWMGYRGNEIIAEATKYNPVRSQTDDDPLITASGKKVREGIVACPEWLPFGTKIEYDGVTYICEDRMAERYRDKNCFDFLTLDMAEAINFGRKVVIIRILNN